MILLIDNQIDQLRQAHFLILPHCWLWTLGTESGKEVSGWTIRLTTTVSEDEATSDARSV